MATESEIKERLVAHDGDVHPVVLELGGDYATTEAEVVRVANTMERSEFRELSTSEILERWSRY